MANINITYLKNGPKLVASLVYKKIIITGPIIDFRLTYRFHITMIVLLVVIMVIVVIIVIVHVVRDIVLWFLIITTPIVSRSSTRNERITSLNRYFFFFSFLFLPWKLSFVPRERTCVRTMIFFRICKKEKERKTKKKIFVTYLTTCTIERLCLFEYQVSP